MPYPEPTLYAVPIFALGLVLEAMLLRRRRARGLPVLGYEKRDARASIGMGIASTLSVSAINLGVFTIATWLAPYRMFDLGEGALGWAVAMVGWDFLYYWNHRFEHATRVLWACHVNHHSSQYFNFSTALRQPWTPVSHLVIYPCLALLGVPPWMILASAGLNLIYQYFIHTEAIDRMPGWFELVFNTPSHHRVHHGVNPEYLDKNFGGILILWDRLFGSFSEERARVIYGLPENLRTYNLFRIAFHEYAAIASDMRAANGVKAKLAMLRHWPSQPGA